MQKLVLCWATAVAVLQPSADSPEGPPVAPKEKPFRPVARVVGLLKDMQKQLEKEQKEDQELHEKMDCWCETNEKTKTEALDDAAQKIEELTSSIESYAAKSGQLSQEIKQLGAEIAENNESLMKATKIREKENAAFSTEEKDMVDTVSALERAIKALSGVHGEGGDEGAKEAQESFVQLKSTLRRLDTPKFRQIMQKDLWDIFGSLGDHQQPKLSTAQVLQEMFLAPTKDQKLGLVQQPGGVAAKSYNARSGQIFGMLKQMKDEFEKNLSTAQKEEKTAQESFAKLKASLRAEIGAATKAKKQKTAELAETNQKNAQAKEDLKDTREAQTADQKFMEDLTKRCATADSEYEERQRTRSDEIKAVGDTIGILMEDEARELTSKTLGFLQSHFSTSRRNLAAKKIAMAARKFRSTHLASLAVSMRLDAFTKVKKAMDDMLAELKREQEDEFKHRDWCNKEIDSNEDSMADKKRHKEDVESTNEDLTNFLDKTKSEIETLKRTISELQTEMKRAGEDRAAENKAFQQTVADQRATKQILRKALARLEKFYNPKAEGETQAAPSLIQKNEPGRASGAPPPQKTYERSGGATGVLGLLQDIIADADRMEQEAVADEQEAQTAYAEFISNTNVSVRGHQKSVVEKSSAKAQAEIDLSESKEDLGATMNDLETLHNYNGELHRSCDFVMKNFDTRQRGRQEEMDSIEEAKAILSGANFGS